MLFEILCGCFCFWYYYCYFMWYFIEMVFFCFCFRFLLFVVAASVMSWVQIQIHFVQFLIIISACASLVILKNLMRVMFCLLNQSYSMMLSLVLFGLLLLYSPHWLRCAVCSTARILLLLLTFFVLKIYLVELIIISFFVVFQMYAQCFALNKSQHQLSKSESRTRFIPFN